MRSSKQNGTGPGAEARQSERRAATPSADASQSGALEQADLAAAMTDALDDILRWERASERSMKIAAVQPAVSD